MIYREKFKKRSPSETIWITLRLWEWFERTPETQSIAGEINTANDFIHIYTTIQENLQILGAKKYGFTQRSLDLMVKFLAIHSWEDYSRKLQELSKSVNSKG